jgi:hypothetical protein
MDRLQGAQRYIESIFSLHRRKAVAKWAVKRYSKAKTLGKASMTKLGVGYKYVAHKVATDESARMLLAALLLVILFTWVVSATVKRRRNRRKSQNAKRQQQQKLAEVNDPVARTVTRFKPIPKVRKTSWKIFYLLFNSAAEKAGFYLCCCCSDSLEI